MTTNIVPRHVTRIRGEFMASERLRDVVSEFYDDDHQPPEVRLHTTAQRIVPRRLYHAHAYEQELGRAEKRLQTRMARQALYLLGTPAPGILRSREGQIKITFDANPAATLMQITDTLGEIPSWEPMTSQTRIALELGRAGLHDNPEMLNAAKMKLLEALHDPRPQNALTVGPPQLSAQDKLHYPVLNDRYWPV